jgi:hypothetical protein
MAIQTFDPNACPCVAPKEYTDPVRDLNIRTDKNYIWHKQHWYQMEQNDE